MTAASENVHGDACRQSDAVIAFFFNVKSDEGNAFFVLIFAHLHHGMELGCVEGTIFVGIKHGEHHFHEFFHVIVVIMSFIVAVRAVFRSIIYQFHGNI